MKRFICPYCKNDLMHHSELCGGEIGYAEPIPEIHPVAEFIESIPMSIRIMAIVLIVLIIALFSASTFAGGGYFEAPVVNGYCRPFMAPPKPWKRLYSFDEAKIMQGKIKVVEIKKFQVNHCFEYDEVERGKIIREYVISEEWYVEDGRK